MISVIDRKQTDNGTLKKYVADTYSELQDSSEKVCGNIAYCIEDKSWYLLNSSSEWVKLGNSEDLTEIWEAIKNSIPIGYIYIQLANQSYPTDLFGGTWTNVSSTYAGLFFRIEGGSAANFGNSQDMSIQSHRHYYSGTTSGNTHRHGQNVCNNDGDGLSNPSSKSQGPAVSYDPSNSANEYSSGYESGNGNWFSKSHTYRIYTDYNSHSHTFSGNTDYTGSTETRPVNTTIRIWKKIAN